MPAAKTLVRSATVTAQALTSPAIRLRSNSPTHAMCYRALAIVALHRA